MQPLPATGGQKKQTENIYYIDNFGTTTCDFFFLSPWVHCSFKYKKKDILYYAFKVRMYLSLSVFDVRSLLDTRLKILLKTNLPIHADFTPKTC